MTLNFKCGLATTAVLFFATGILNFATAQSDSATTVDAFDKVLVNWYNRDGSKDKIHGVSVDRAYKELLKDKKPQKTIVVAVIDSGVDTEHVELQGKIWTNPNEIPGNGIDDDNNGYVDDIHGWGFLGNPQGENIMYETYEYVRIVRDLAPKYEHVKSVDEVPAQEAELYQTYLASREAYVEEYKKQVEMKETLTTFEYYFSQAEAVLVNHIGKENITLDDIKRVNSKDQAVSGAKKWLQGRYEMGFTKADLQKAKEYNDRFLEYHLNPSFNPRHITGDNPEDITDTNYGNNDVKGPRADHGTPIAGIIAGIRGNNIGIDGIAENVQIMALRAVPQGDEYDKDIALAIRYAVDNGAHIINMSFGKAFSPQKSFVDDAVKYAEERNVLLVHAAGNDGKNTDEETNFPNRALNNGYKVGNWIEVGAISRTADKTFPASFSNYGKENVDIFAPGVDIIGINADNTYAQVDGTSFAGPVVTGVAALVWSHYPELTAVELKEVLLSSSRTYPKLSVNLPETESEGKTKKKVKFSELSKTGGVVNAYEALKLAEKKVKAKAPRS